MEQTLKQLVSEALEITKELGDVVFIGALATHMHTKTARDSQDIDFIVTKPIPEKILENKGYKKSQTGKQPWFTQGASK